MEWLRGQLNCYAFLVSLCGICCSCFALRVSRFSFYSGICGNFFLVTRMCFSFHFGIWRWSEAVQDGFSKSCARRCARMQEPMLRKMVAVRDVAQDGACECVCIYMFYVCVRQYSLWCWWRWEVYPRAWMRQLYVFETFTIRVKWRRSFWGPPIVWWLYYKLCSTWHLGLGGPVGLLLVFRRTLLNLGLLMWCSGRIHF